MMTREEIIHEYEAAVAAHAAAAALEIKGAEKSYELFRAGLSDLRPVSWEQVEKVWRGEWVRESTPDLLKGNAISHCSRCWHHVYRPEEHTRFCPHCGAPMTDEAVQMVMERLEALKDGSTTD